MYNAYKMRYKKEQEDLQYHSYANQIQGNLFVVIITQKAARCRARYGRMIMYTSILQISSGVSRMETSATNTRYVCDVLYTWCHIYIVSEISLMGPLLQSIFATLVPVLSMSHAAQIKLRTSSGHH